VESWRKAWDGPNRPVRPYEDSEWLERRRSWLENLPSGEGIADEVAAENYRMVQAQWVLDHIEELEQVAPEVAAEARRMREEEHDR